ncbi:MAG: hypothetical protein Q8P18_27470 [Pseudomonadota bacterium]|nr:hypothetical protein [Pseudomonadota bacterium]
MSDNRPETPAPSKKPPEPSWLDQLRDRFAELMDSLVEPPMPVPVPVRPRR